MHIPPVYFLPLPPSLMSDPWGYAVSNMGLFGGSIITLEWGSRIAYGLIDDRHPFKHPLTFMRWIMLMVLIAVGLRIFPQVASTMLWPEIQPATRWYIARANRIMQGVSLAPYFIAWVGGMIAAPFIDFQLIRKPLPMELFPTWKKMRRPIFIATIVIFISLAVAFQR